MYRVPIDPDHPHMALSYKVSFWRWLTSSREEREEHARRRNLATRLAAERFNERLGRTELRAKIAITRKMLKALDALERRAERLYTEQSAKAKTDRKREKLSRDFAEAKLHVARTRDEIMRALAADEAELAASRSKKEAEEADLERRKAEAAGGRDEAR